jgi:hypothetical protein
MKWPPECQTAPAGNRGGGSGENGLLADKTKEINNLPASPLQVFRHHVDAPLRRPKTIEELHAGAEYVELFDRRFPGRLARGARP